MAEAQGVTIVNNNDSGDLDRLVQMKTITSGDWESDRFIFLSTGA